MSADTHSVRTASTDANGYYAVTDLAVGEYTLWVSVAGFQKQEQKGG